MQHRVEHRGEPVRPGDLAVLLCDQIVAQLDQHIGPTGRQRVPVDRIPVEMTGVGFVIADAEPFGRERRDQRFFAALPDVLATAQQW